MAHLRATRSRVFTAVSFLALGNAGCAATAAADAASVRYLSAAETKPTGSAPSAKHRLLSSTPDGARSFVLILATGDEVVSGLLQLAQRERVESARFTAIGGVSQAEFGYFELDKKKYKAFKYERQLEVLSLAGDIALDPEGKPTVHAHVVLGDVDGGAIGGHLISALVRPTLEVFVNVYPTRLQKRDEPETDTQVIELDKTSAIEDAK